MKEKILAFLATRAGSIEDPAGRGLTAELAEAIGYDRPAALNVLLGQMESDGVITRDVRGLRTYKIALSDYRPPTVAASGHPVPPDQPAAGRRSLRDSITDPSPPSPPGAPSASGRPPTVDWRALADEPTPGDQIGPRGNGTRGQRVPRAGAGAGSRTVASADDAELGDATGPADPWRRADPAVAPPSDPAPSDPAPGHDSVVSWAPPGAEEPDDDPSPRVIANRSGSARSHWWAVELPHVRGAPSNTVLAIVGVTLAALVIATLIAVFTSGGSGPAKVADNANSTIDSCTLVTSQEVSVAFGSDAKEPHRVLGSCVFDNGSRQLIVDAADNRAKPRFDAARGDGAQDVPGLGDSAYYANGRLGVLKGQRMALITLVPYSPTNVSPALLALARTVVARL